MVLFDWPAGLSRRSSSSWKRSICRILRTLADTMCRSWWRRKCTGLEVAVCRSRRKSWREIISMISRMSNSGWWILGSHWTGGMSCSSLCVNYLLLCICFCDTLIYVFTHFFNGRKYSKRSERIRIASLNIFNYDHFFSCIHKNINLLIQRSLIIRGENKVNEWRWRRNKFLISWYQNWSM